MNRAAYLEWAATAAPRERRTHRAKDLDQAMALRGTFDLIEATGLAPQAAAWLAGITLEAVTTHPDLFRKNPAGDSNKLPPLLVAWASCAPNRRPTGIDINERRFERWVASPRYEWDEFYRFTLEALKVVRGLAFDLGSLYEIAELRLTENDIAPESFGFVCANQFYLNQPNPSS